MAAFCLVTGVQPSEYHALDYETKLAFLAQARRMRRKK